MLKQVLRELRYHPSRFIATTIAIAISVAFLAGSSVLVATEQNALERQQSLPIAAADVVLTVHPEVDPAALKAAVLGTGEVAVLEPSLVAQVGLRRDAFTTLVNLIGLPSPDLRWSKVSAGRWPEQPGEVTLTKGAAAAFQAGIGDTVSVRDDLQLTVVGLTGEPSGLFLHSGTVAPAQFRNFDIDPAVGTGTWLVRSTDPDGEATALASTLTSALAGLGGVEVSTADQARAEALSQLAGEFDVFRNLLWAFAAIAAVVGMITIANTFTILLAQRRRQIGLLRAVGAAGAQVRRRFFLEALALGALGSVLGLALGIGLTALAGLWTGSLYWGLVLPAVDLAIAAVAGVLITVLAAYLPVLRGTKVHPLEALQPEPAADERRRATAVRATLCGVLVVAGLGVALAGLPTSEALLIAIAGSALVALGVLFGAPVFVPVLLRGLGAVVGRLGVTARLAAQNAARNPRRASTTATALMLAVGLIVTLQVGTASVRAGVLEQLDRDNPVDVSVTFRETPKTLPAELLQQLARIPGVDKTASLASTTADVERGGERHEGLTVSALTPEAAAIASGDVRAVADDQILVVPNASAPADGQAVTVHGRDATLSLTAVSSPLVMYGEVMVSPATLEALGGAVPDALVWLSVPDRSHAMSVAGAVSELAAAETYWVTGAVVEAASIESILDLLLVITTALLAVAVLIALIGVSNTLGLSVMERTRESALMRALGLQARSLRLMLLVEALLLAAVGVGVGVLAGVFFGWLGATAMAGPIGADVGLSVNLPQTLAMVAVAVLAAALASVLPGRRAAKASPTEALADI